MRNYFLVVLFFLISAKSTYSSRIELFDRKYAANQTIHFNVLKTDPFPALHKNRAMNNLSSQMSQSELYLPLTSVHSRSKEKFPKCKVVYEFALVVDATMTFVDNFNTGYRGNESFLDKLVRITKSIVLQLYLENKNSKFSLTTFGDYPTKENDNLEDGFCYKYVMTTSDVWAFLEAVRSINSTYGGKDNNESSLTALLYTMTEPAIKWTLGSNNVIKIIALATDTYLKSHDEIPKDAGPEYNYPVPDGYADCPPKMSTVLDLQKNRDFFLIPTLFMSYGLWSKERKPWEVNLINKIFSDQCHWSSDVFREDEYAKEGLTAILQFADYMCNPKHNCREFDYYDD